MSLWGWLIGYIVLFAVLHLVLYYAYVRQNGETTLPSVTDGEHTGFQSAPRADTYRTHRGDGGESVDVDDLDISGESTTCPHCGAPNEHDQVYTYCRVCVSPLRQ
ncbi:DUF7577 domain-containing protein [Natronosalvus vescus]|uniref:DUF7577 domain-containing protein n=1 Tax=Natronosalvus vescus TaxID=2953881 RepID=UPI002090E645|nr:hypothetical protein [Natronosalvus vescus]